MTGCQSSSDSDTSGETEWDKIETAEPAEVTMETVNGYLNVYGESKSLQSSRNGSHQLDMLRHDLLGSLNIGDLLPRGKQLTSAADESSREDIFEGNIDGTFTRNTTLNTTTGDFVMDLVYDHYKDDSDTDVCGNPDMTQQHGTMHCEGNSNPSNNYTITYIKCTMQGDLSVSNGTIKSGSYIAYAPSPDLGTEGTHFNYTLIGYNSETDRSFAFVDTNETVWEANTTYEYSYLSKGTIYFNDFSEYLTVDTSWDSSRTPLIEEVCTNTVYSGTERLLGKDSGLIELNVTAPNILQISIDADRNGSWDEQNTISWDSWSL